MLVVFVHFGPCNLKIIHKVAQQDRHRHYTAHANVFKNEVDPLCFKILQAQQHDFSCVLKEGGSVLLLPFLNPVAVDTERAAVNEFADAADRVWIPGQYLPSQWANSAITAVDSDTGQHADDQHLRRKDRNANLTGYSMLYFFSPPTHSP